MRSAVYRSFFCPQVDKITVPHSERVTVRCRELGKYKLVGEPVLHCRNGAWNGQLPSCIPTTALSNYTGEYCAGGRAAARHLCLPAAGLCAAAARYLGSGSVDVFRWRFEIGRWVKFC